ncbi:hypothetical protein L3V83_10060 [Thiotrichales bacterium 19X7-9]|nr:hypothetical protein [Thiotrichales bacterium 19X7-9]
MPYCIIKLKVDSKYFDLSNNNALTTARLYDAIKDNPNKVYIYDGIYDEIANVRSQIRQFCVYGYNDINAIAELDNDQNKILAIDYNGRVSLDQPITLKVIKGQFNTNCLVIDTDNQKNPQLVKQEESQQNTQQSIQSTNQTNNQKGQFSSYLDSFSNFFKFNNKNLFKSNNNLNQPKHHFLDYDATKENTSCPLTDNDL